jgi:hypothetical protein
MKNGGWNATRPVPALFHLPAKLSLPEMKVLSVTYWIYDNER